MFTDLSGDIIGGKYLIESQISAAPRGLFRATEIQTGRTVAIKFFYLGQRLNGYPYSEFFDENDRLAGLLHPNVVQILDYGCSDAVGTAYQVCEFLPGMSLDKLLKIHDTLPLDTAISIITQVGEATLIVYQHNEYSRNLLPSHIQILNPDRAAEQVKILNILTSGWGATVCGKPIALPEIYYYLTPELAAGKFQGQVSFIYILAVILFQMVCDKRLYLDVSRLPVAANAYLSTYAPQLLMEMKGSIPDAVIAALQKGLTYRPANRQQSIREFLNDVNNW
jgi:eukaryotic-like serine/threonine-protein kinase